MIDYNMIKIGQRIKEIRIERNLTQKELANLLGVAQNTISQYEKGTANASVEVIVRLSQILQTTTDFLLLGIE